MRTLFIAEKPSVARDIAAVLGVRSRGNGYLESDRYVVSWCFGHLAGVAPDPGVYDDAWGSWRLDTLPMIPSAFRIVETGDAKQLAVLKRLLNAPDIAGVVNACDAAREGEAIFRNVYEYAGSNKPIRRFWVASMTEAAIRHGLKTLKPGSDYDALADAARSREEADWLVGINATRALTLRARAAGADALFSVGRVQTPTLALIVERDQRIENFECQPFWQVHATFRASDVQVLGRPDVYDAVYIHDGGDRLPTQQAAEAVAHAVRADPLGRVIAVDETDKRQRPPLLYDLTMLQREANVRHGFSAKQTLDAAQSLYERHKLLTYPRTDSAYLTDDLAESLTARVSACASGSWSQVCVTVLEQGLTLNGRLINDAKVSDHHAILPTETAPKLADLSATERTIYELVCRRMLAGFFGDVVHAHAQIAVEVAGHRFVAKGKRLVEEGWHATEPPRSDPRATVTLLPAVSPGEEAPLMEARLHAGQTVPPKRYSESSLLGAMETAGKELDDDELREAMKERGLGTPATRASVIELLISREYIARDRKALVSTELGRELISALPDPTLKSAELTGKWEAALLRVQQGRLPRAAFMAKIKQFTESACRNIVAADVAVSAPTREVLGACPFCGKDVFETPKVYTCSSGRDCKFVVFKTIAAKRITVSMAKKLVRDRRTPKLKGFKSKKGSRFEAALELTDEGKVSFVFD